MAEFDRRRRRSVLAEGGGRAGDGGGDCRGGGGGSVMAVAVVVVVRPNAVRETPWVGEREEDAVEIARGRPGGGCGFNSHFALPVEQRVHISLLCIYILTRLYDIIFVYHNTIILWSDTMQYKIIYIPQYNMIYYKHSLLLHSINTKYKCENCFPIGWFFKKGIIYRRKKLIII